MSGLFRMILLGIKENEDLTSLFPEGIGLTMFMHGFGDDKSFCYISNAQRKDMIKSLKEFIERAEAE